MWGRKRPQASSFSNPAHNWSRCVSARGSARASTWRARRARALDATDWRPFEPRPRVSIRNFEPQTEVEPNLETGLRVETRTHRKSGLCRLPGRLEKRERELDSPERRWRPVCQVHLPGLLPFLPPWHWPRPWAYSYVIAQFLKKYEIGEFNSVHFHAQDPASPPPKFSDKRPQLC